MFPRAHAFILGAVAALGLLVAVGRPLLKLQNAAFTADAYPYVVWLGRVESGVHTVSPVEVVP